MSSSTSSRVRLLRQQSPLDLVSLERLQAYEERVSALLVPFGHTLGQEQAPLGSILLVVEGGLRIVGRDSSGTDFTRRVSSGQWWGTWSSFTGLSSSSCRATADTKLLSIPLDIWHELIRDDHAAIDSITNHPCREDFYAAFRSLLVSRELQDLSLPELLDKLEANYLCKFVFDVGSVNSLFSSNSDYSWFPQFPQQLLPENGIPSYQGISCDSLQSLISKYPDGLPIIGIPTDHLHLLMDCSLNSSHDVSDTVIEEPEWKNPDSSELLALALQQDQGPVIIRKDQVNIKPVLGVTAVEQGLALLQMICELLNLPFRRDVVDRMLSGMVLNRSSPSLEIIGQISDALGLTAVMSKVPSSHLSRVTLPAVVESNDGLLFLLGSVGTSLKFIDPREGERLIPSKISMNPIIFVEF